MLVFLAPIDSCKMEELALIFDLLENIALIECYIIHPALIKTIKYDKDIDLLISKQNVHIMSHLTY